MDENCLVSTDLEQKIAQHCAIENSREIWEKPIVVGKPMGTWLFYIFYVFENLKSIDVILKIEDDVILIKVYRTSVSAHDLLGPVSEHSFN